MLTLAAAAALLTLLAIGLAVILKPLFAPATYGKMSTLRRAMEKAYPNHCASMRSIRDNSSK